MHLSIRGTVEIRVFAALSNGEDFKMDDKVHELDDAGRRRVGELQQPPGAGQGSYLDFKVKDQERRQHLVQARTARDAAREQSIRHGYQLFSDSKGEASCIACHVDYGRQVNFRYDKWGTMVRPMNLTTGVYRGGRRPIDLYWRIKGGIDPSGMPDAKTLSEKDVWDVVNFVHNLPYPRCCRRMSGTRFTTGRLQRQGGGRRRDEGGNKSPARLDSSFILHPSSLRGSVVVQKLWAVFFGVVLGGIFVLCVVSPWVGWWMPQNISSFGGDVDNLFYIILWVTGGAFVLTEGLLVWCMWRYSRNPQRKAAFVHGNHRLELFWTVATAAILLYIAFAQVNVWERIKYQGLMPQPDQIITVTARQWEWRLRYPAVGDKTDAEGRAWAEAPEVDDLRIQNELHTWKGAKVRIYLKTQDVIHSFGLPNLRLMQDALPGKTIPMWFTATESNTLWEGSKWRCTEPDDPAQALGDRLQGAVRRRPLSHARPDLRPPRPGRF